MKKVQTTKTLTEMLFKQLEGLQDGTIDTKEARAFSKTASQIVYASRLDLENKRIEMQLMKTICRPSKNIDGAKVSIPTLELS